MANTCGGERSRNLVKILMSKGKSSCFNLGQMMLIPDPGNHFLEKQIIKNLKKNQIKNKINIKDII